MLKDMKCIKDDQLTCTYIVSSVCVSHTLARIPDDDPRRDRNMLD
jgi:hypothetical protein